LTNSLHSSGWRQGSIFRGNLPLPSITLDVPPASGEDGATAHRQTRGRLRAWLASQLIQIAPSRLSGRNDDSTTTSPALRQAPHSLWCLATQDCDLDRLDPSDLEPSVEIRPVFASDPPGDWGIRSRKLRLSAEHYIEADAPRVNIAPAALAGFESDRLPEISDGRKRALKTWLGLRYDRPAVPPEWLDLISEIAKQLARKKDESRDQVHDVLLQFHASDPPEYAIFAVITETADPEKIRKWIAEGARRVPTELGVMAGVEVGTKAEFTLDLLENSYSADLSKITWRGESPTGAA
jgi:hypothetical protein